jgi:hypothetical protein
MTRARIYSQSGIGGGANTGGGSGNVTLASLSPFLTTANVVELTNLYFSNVRVSQALSNISINALLDVNTTSSFTGQSLVYNGNTWVADSPFFAYTTDSLQQGNVNFYYSNALARTALTAADPTIVIDWAAGTIRANVAAVAGAANTTDSITEGYNNLYYTNSRVDGRIQLALSVLDLANTITVENSDFANVAGFVETLSNFTTANLAEASSNLYFTPQRVEDAFANISINALSDVVTSGNLLINQILSWDGSVWRPANVRIDNLNSGNLIEGFNLYFTNARAVVAITPLLTTANVKETNANLYYTNARVNAFVQPFLTTANVVERTNQYFTNVRVLQAVNPLLTTSNVIEGSNPYFTNARAVVAITPVLTTANVTELTNQYFTNTRVLLATATNDVTVGGNLTVSGSSTTLNVDNVQIRSKTITIAKDSASPAAADGSGIFINGANASLIFDEINDSIDINKNIIISGNLLPSVSGVFNVGSRTKKFLSMYLGTQTLFLGNLSLGESASGGLEVKTASGAPSDGVFANLSTTESVTLARVYGNVFPLVEVQGYVGGNVEQFVTNETGNLYFGIKKNGDWNKFAGIRVVETRTSQKPTTNTYVWSVINNFASDYTFSGYSSGNDISITVNAGDTITFNVNATGHPFWIKTAQVTGTGSPASNVINNGTAVGNVTWYTTGITPGTYYYVCEDHVAMSGTITILADTQPAGNVRSDVLIYNDNEVTNNSIARISVLGDGNVNILGNIYLDLGSKFYGNVKGDLIGNVTGTVSTLFNHTTSNLNEGINLYYTNSRVRSALSNSTGVYYNSSTGQFSIGQDVATTSNVTFQNLTVLGNIYVQGNASYINSNTLIINDPLIQFGYGNPGDSYDLGFVGHYNTGGIERHAGFFRDHTDGKFKIFDNLTVEPGINDIDIGNVTFRYANVVATTFEGNVFASGITTSTASITGNATITGILSTKSNNGITLGTPRLGSLTSNAITMTVDTTVTDGITQINQILGKLVPTAPRPLSTATGNLSILNSSSFSTQRMCNFTQTINGPTATQTAAGSTVSSVLRTNTWVSTWINDVGPGDTGTVTVYYNGVAAGSKALATGSDNGTYGNLTIADNVDYGTKTGQATGFWESMDLRANSTVSPPGWNEVYIAHSQADNSNIALWYNDINSPGTPTLTGNIFGPTSNSYTYSSTVPHFNSSSTWRMYVNVNKLSGDFYHSSDTFITGASGGAFQTPASITYSSAGITTPLAQNLYRDSGNIQVTTTAAIVTGFGRNIGAGPSLTVQNGYTTGTATITPFGNVLYKTGTSSTMEESAITVGSAFGSGVTTVSRIQNPGSGDTPAYTANAFLFNSTTSTLQPYDATIVGATLKHDTTNYSVGYWPAGPNLTTQASVQYYTFRAIRTSLSKFNIKYTGNIAGMWVAVPGSAIDTTSTLNGWVDMSLAYAGSGVPGANIGGNGTNGCALGGPIVPNRQITNSSNTCTFGTVSTSSTATNEVYVRIKLTAGQTITALSLETASN